MPFFNPQPVVAASSTAFSISAQIRIGNPFNAASVTWTEIENSTAEAWAGFFLTSDGSQIRGIGLIAKGAASSEVIIASFPTLSTQKTPQRTMYIPIPVAAGTRLSVGASSSTTATFRGQVVGVPSSNFSAEPAFTVMESGPYNLAGGSGSYANWASFDPGGTANTKGSYSELSFTGGSNANNVLNGDSLANSLDYIGLMLSDNFGVAQTSQYRLIDVAYGAAASETIILPDAWSRVGSSEQSTAIGSPLWVPWGRASGDRMSARGQSSITDATDRICTTLMFGVR